MCTSVHWNKQTKQNASIHWKPRCPSFTLGLESSLKPTWACGWLVHTHLRFCEQRQMLCVFLDIYEHWKVFDRENSRFCETELNKVCIKFSDQYLFRFVCRGLCRRVHRAAFLIPEKLSQSKLHMEEPCIHPLLYFHFPLFFLAHNSLFLIFSFPSLCHWWFFQLSLAQSSVFLPFAFSTLPSYFFLLSSFCV